MIEIKNEQTETSRAAIRLALDSLVFAVAMTKRFPYLEKKTVEFGRHMGPLCRAVRFEHKFFEVV